MTTDAMPPFFYEIFAPCLARQGPGDDSATERAFRRLTEAGLGRGTGTDGVAGLGSDAASIHAAEAPRKLRVLDVGCGSGAQTLVLARQTGTRVVAIDNHQPFLDELEGRARTAGLDQDIEARLQDMKAMDESTLGGLFDLVWAEGSLFVMGFAEGLRACRRVLKPGGFLAASELTWLRPDPPEECRAYLAAEYPPMTDVAGNLALLTECSYRPIAHFVLPESAWWPTFYEPLAVRVAELCEKYPSDTEKVEMLAWVDREIEMYRRFSSYYGYVFVLAQSDDAIG